MNTVRLFRVCRWLLLGALAAPAGAQMVAANDRVRVEVRTDNESDHKDLPKTNADAITQHKQLNIILSGKERSNEARVIEWTVYGRNVRNNDVRVVGSGKVKVAFDAQGKQTVETKTVSTTYTPEHSITERLAPAGCCGRAGGSGCSYQAGPGGRDEDCGLYSQGAG
jgi:hypothetical protein